MARPRKPFHIIVSRWQAEVATAKGVEVVTATSQQRLANYIQKQFGKVAYTPIAAQLQMRVWMPNLLEDGAIVIKKERISATTRARLFQEFEARKHAIASAVWHRFGESVPTNLPYDYQELVKAWGAIQEGRDTSGRLRGQPTLSEWILRTLDERLMRAEITANYSDSVKDVLNAQINRDFNSKTMGRTLSLGSLQLKQISQALFQEFVDDLCQRKVANSKENPSNLSPAYINNIIAYIQASWAMLAADPLLSRYESQLAFTRHRLRRPKKRQQSRPNLAYTPHEVELLVAACQSPTDLAIVGIALTGARMPGEGRGVKWDDFFLDEDGKTRFLRVERQIVYENQKNVERSRKRIEGGEAVILHVPDRVWSMIQAVKTISDGAGSAYVLTGGRKGRSMSAMSSSAIQDRFDRIKERAQITRRGATLYAFRHTVTSMVMEIGGEEAARRVGGWTTSKVLRLHYDQARARILLPRAGEQLPWATGTLPDFVGDND